MLTFYTTSEAVGAAVEAAGAEALQAAAVQSAVGDKYGKGFEARLTILFVSIAALFPILLEIRELPD